MPIPFGPATDRQLRNRRLLQTRDARSVCLGVANARKAHDAEAPGTRNESGTEFSPRREPSGEGDYPLMPGPRAPKPHNVGGGVAYQGNTRNNYGDEDEGPIKNDGNLNADEAGLCQCGPCKKRRAEVAAARGDSTEDEALEGSMDCNDASPAKINQINRARYGRK
jgi:hypothetical protein